MDFSQDLIRGSVVPIVLNLLNERTMYGYEMVKLVDARTGGKLQWREGTLYPALHRLEGEGLLRSKWQMASAGQGRKRKYYAITAKGRAELSRRVKEWEQFSLSINTMLSLA
jgi:PadR family transcriptional regulator PadR